MNKMRNLPAFLTSFRQWIFIAFFGIIAVACSKPTTVETSEKSKQSQNGDSDDGDQNTEKIIIIKTIPSGEPASIESQGASVDFPEGSFEHEVSITLEINNSILPSQQTLLPDDLVLGAIELITRNEEDKIVGVEDLKKPIQVKIQIRTPREFDSKKMRIIQETRAANLFSSEEISDFKVKAIADNLMEINFSTLQPNAVIFIIYNLAAPKNSDPVAADLAFAYAKNEVSYPIQKAILPNSPSVQGESCEVTPELPAGLKLESNSGAISGTPTKVSAQSDYLISCTIDGKVKSTYLKIEILDIPPANLSYAVSAINLPINQAITPLQPSVSGGSITQFSISPALPAGLQIDASTGVISGTPSAATSSITYEITASNSYGLATTDLTIEAYDGLILVPGNISIRSGYD